MTKLYRIGFYQDRIKINTENPEKEIWDMIMKFGDIFYLKKKWPGRSDEDYFNVFSWIKQSYEFQLAAKNVDINTKPLLLYYSFLNLSKAILFLVKDIKPTDYHGLASPKLEEEFLNISVNIKDGIFKEICELMGDNFGQKNLQIDIKKMLDNFLEINFDYADYFGIESGFISPEVNIYLDGDIEIKIKDNIDLFKNHFKEYKLLKKDNGEKYFYKKIIIQEGNESLLDQEFSKLFKYNTMEDGNYYLNKGDCILSNVASIYGLMFILGSIVRYNPHYFYKFTNNGDKSISHFIQKILNISNRVYPNLMLNLLNGKDIVFGKKIIFGPE